MAKPLPACTMNIVRPQVQQPLLRPFSVLGQTAWQRCVEADKPVAATVPPATPLPAVADQKAETRIAMQSLSSGKAAVDGMRSNSMVFEVGLSFVVLHYQSIFIGVMRCLFQSFRPLLILFVFGQIIKAVFFVAGAPIWLSFYSIWLFEVIYGLAQCAISFIFISFFYNNLSFARLRPALSHALRQQRQKFANLI